MKLSNRLLLGGLAFLTLLTLAMVFVFKAGLAQWIQAGL